LIKIKLKVGTRQASWLLFRLASLLNALVRQCRLKCDQRGSIFPIAAIAAFLIYVNAIWLG